MGEKQTKGAASALSAEVEAKGPLPSPSPSPQPGAPPAVTGQERGTPSPHLQKAVEGGIVDDGSGDYEAITDAASESGVYTIVGGYLDDDRVLHNEVHVRSLSGDEEELLSNENIDIVDRLTGMMTACTERIGTITDKGQITQAIHRLPMGSRKHLLICLRRVTHWKRHKDNYEMDIRCPIDDCQQVGSYKVNLGDLEVYEMAEPDRREYTEELLDSGNEVVWRVATLPQEKMYRAVGRSKDDDFKILTYAIMARLVSLNGVDVKLNLEDFIRGNTKKIQLSKRAESLYQTVRKWSSGDRDQLRESFFLNEPDVNTVVDIKCSSCKRDFEGEVDITQRTFFFPSATSRRSKQRSFI